MSSLWTVAFLFLLPIGAQGVPGDLEGYTKQNGGFVQLPPGSYVQGSVSYGGIQPDYKINVDDPALDNFLKEVVALARNNPDIRKAEYFAPPSKVRDLKIAFVTDLIRQTLVHRSYDSVPYLKVLREHRELSKDINLGSYIQCSAGVCRENALLTHQALQALKIESYYVYTKVQVGQRIEDHAMVVVKDANRLWIVDPYNATFHGRDFNEMRDERSLSQLPRLVAPYARKSTYVGRIVEVLNYPTYWIPPASCSHVFN
ncbi:transglutaminase-like domain-containing protein [Bdellovibrio sp. HCB274]|uniref:transglutaminase-like domain-containing protein n=1 Tax=Bdellovibrio sp. HCB274 TaxID=3394361 RepID=UPI0039B4415F